MDVFQISLLSDQVFLSEGKEVHNFSNSGYFNNEFFNNDSKGLVLSLKVSDSSLELVAVALVSMVGVISLSLEDVSKSMTVSTVAIAIITITIVTVVVVFTIVSTVVAVISISVISVTRLFRGIVVILLSEGSAHFL